MARTSALLAMLCAGAGVLAAQEQVSDLKVFHRDGQTFLTFREVDPPKADDQMDPGALRGLVYKAAEERTTLYRVYRSDKPIASVDGLTPIAEVPPGTCWNVHFYGIYPDKRRGAGESNLRYVVTDGGEPLAPGTGVYVHNPKAAGNAYYAVTLVQGGKENAAVSAANATADAVAETPGQGTPVLQRIEKPELFNYVRDATLYYYVRWEAPPNASVESSPFNYLVAVPPNVKYPAQVGIHFHCWGNHLRGGYGHWGNAEKGAILIAPNQVPYDWWTGYHESVRPTFHNPMPSPKEKDAWAKAPVHPYTQNRIYSFFQWACTKWDIDKTRTFAAGASMGGAGSLMFAIRYGDLIAWCRSQVGVHVPSHSPHFKGSYEQVWGREDFGVKFEDGHSVWDYFSDVWYLRTYPNREVGYLVFANGKNDGGIGWPQALEFLRALQETKRPHLFVWQMKGHGSSPTFPNPAGAKGVGRTLPIDVRTDQSLPAFTRCSLDDDPGTATKLPEPKPFTGPQDKKLLDAFDGDSEGQVNAYLCWDTASVVDEPGRWEMTVFLAPNAPKDSCTVDVTPRRCQKFSARAGDAFAWTNAPVDGKAAPASGTVAADKWGLVTLEQIAVTKAKNRLTIVAQGAKP